jgi:hypothetical protein
MKNIPASSSIINITTSKNVRNAITIRSRQVEDEVFARDADGSFDEETGALRSDSELVSRDETRR